LYNPCVGARGLEGSFGIFGLRASFAGMPNVPSSERMADIQMSISVRKCSFFVYFSTAPTIK